jgi:hypothetical protein
MFRLSSRFYAPLQRNVAPAAYDKYTRRNTEGPVAEVEDAMVSAGVPQSRVGRLVQRASSRVRSFRIPRRVSGGMGQGAEVFFGSGQATYNAITAAQNRVIALQDEIATIGKEIWDNAIYGSPSVIEDAGWAPVDNFTYDKMMAFWRPQFSRLLVIGGREPSQSDMNEVNNNAVGTDKLIALVKTLVPAAVAAQAAASRKAVEQRLTAAGPLNSPGAVARQTVIDEIEKKLKTGVSTVIIIAAAAAIVAAGAYAYAMGRK